MSTIRALDGQVGGRQDIIKKTLSETFYLRLTELRNFDIHPHGKAIAIVHIGAYIEGMFYAIVYSTQRGRGIAYPRMVGNAKASVSGMSNEV